MYHQQISSMSVNPAALTQVLCIQSWIRQIFIAGHVGSWSKYGRIKFTTSPSLKTHLLVLGIMLQTFLTQYTVYRLLLYKHDPQTTCWLQMATD